MARKIKHILEYAFLRTAVFLFDLFPYRTAQRMGGTVLGGLAALVGGSRRRTIVRNIEMAFPDITDDERDRITRVTFRNVGRLAAEFIKQPRFDREWMERYVEWDSAGVKYIQDCLDRKQGVLLNGCHAGNWEMLPAILPLKFNAPTYALGANVSNPYTHRWFWKVRQREYMRFVPIDEMGATIVKALKRGEIFAMASDQSAGQKGVFVPYLGRPTSTHTGASQITYLAGAEMLFMIGLRLPEGRFRVEFVPLGRPQDFSSDREEAIRIITLRYVDILEQYVKKYPDQYFWAHKRWKVSPGPDSTHWDRIETGLEPIT